MATIYYDLRKAPVAPNRKDPGYYPVVAPTASISPEDLYERIDNRCTVTVADIKGVVDALAAVIAEELQQGRRVQIPELGYFSLKIAADKNFNTATDKQAAEHLYVDGIQFKAMRKFEKRIGAVNFHRTRVPREGGSLPDDEEVKDIVVRYFETSQESFITSGTLCRLLGCARSSANLRLAALVEAGVLQRKGYRKSPIYVLVKDEDEE